MGEMAEYMLNGDDCEGCGMPFDDEGPGYPRRCASCGGPDEDAPVRLPLKQRKPYACKCGRRFAKPEHMAQHQAANGHVSEETV